MEYASDNIIVKVKIGEIIRKRYLIEYHRPRISMGNETHQTIISGKVRLWRRDTTCQGKGANSRYRSPSGMVVKAPSVVDTSTSRPKPDWAEASSTRVRWTDCKLAKRLNDRLA